MRMRCCLKRTLDFQNTNSKSLFSIHSRLCQSCPKIKVLSAREQPYTILSGVPSYPGWFRSSATQSQADALALLNPDHFVFKWLGRGIWMQQHFVLNAQNRTESHTIPPCTSHLRNNEHPKEVRVCFDSCWSCKMVTEAVTDWGLFCFLFSWFCSPAQWLLGFLLLGTPTATSQGSGRATHKCLD